MKALIENGAGVNTLDSRKYTPLHYAAQCNTNPEVLNVLIEKGADINAITCTYHHQYTPLHFAVKFNTNIEVSKVLIKKGADINALDFW